MKPILAIETSTSTATVALLTEELDIARIYTHQVEGVRGHAESLLPMIDAVLQEAGQTREQIGLIAVGQGPGAFTGIRLACSVSQAIAFAKSLPVVPVSALQAVAAAVDSQQPGIRLVALDARMGEVYFGVYSSQGTRLQRPILLAATDVCHYITPRLPFWRRAVGSDDSARLEGEGWQVVAPDLQAPEWLALSVLKGDTSARPRADVMARVAQLAWRAGATLRPEQALPLYLRDRVAFTTQERSEGLGGNPKVAAPSNEFIFPMMPLDISEVEQLERRSQAFPWTARNFQDALSVGYPAWVVRREGRAVGFCVAMPTPDDVHVLAIAVDPDSRRQGVGRQLLEEVYFLTQELGLTRVLLEVRSSNERAIRFYQKQGFTQIGLRKGYYPAAKGQREDAMVMAFDLAQRQL
jgi:tRNA threonylcarbamoyladenosine biosynthesis protein TsaB